MSIGYHSPAVPAVCGGATVRSDAPDDLTAIEPLFSRVTPRLPPVQFIGTTGARYNMGGGQPDPPPSPARC